MEYRDLKTLLSDMSLEEKVGQMIQISGKMLVDGGVVTGPTETIEITEEMSSLVGSILNISGAEQLRTIQQEFMKKHPHHIPLMFMLDVINGMETIFPIPLAQGCTFSPELVEKAARVSAIEAGIKGIHVTFSPMLDLVRDPRWGRVMESTGEDPWLNALLGKAMVRGYQGERLQDNGNIAGCVKHFAAYGAPEGGREYDNVEISERTLREDYFPAYQAAIEEGCAMVMTSFNTYNRIPSSANKWLMRKVLREEMGFEGVLISDYAAIDELIRHGIAENSREAAKLAILAGVDIDMVSSCYVKYLAELVRSGEVEEKLIDESVMRILQLKNELGLFENPFKDGLKEQEKLLLACKEHRETARKVASASFVLLKNEELLPLEKESSELLAVIGPYADNKQIYGSWSSPENVENIITVKQGIEKKKSNAIFQQGCPMLDENMVTRRHMKEDYSAIELEQMYKEAVELARNVDKVILCLGEHRDQSGEGGSRTCIQLPEKQMELLRRIQKVNDNIITVVFSGRPIEMKEIVALSKAVVMAWMPGTEGGHAIADVLFGEASPEGKLAMTLPRTVGQVPIYYNQFMTGRPNKTGTSIGFCHGYIDESTKPLYPFGYGLSYTTFEYSTITLEKNHLNKAETLIAEVTITNTGKREGIETVQMYLRDMKASVVRPLKMLRGVQKICLQPGECKKVTFEIQENMLRFYDIDMQYVSEPGEFQVFIGADSSTDNMAIFYLE